ncbi:esterase-like activity of phytase family protein [Aquabacterium soli]|nr:esterase-like activity of phytase family protein [Aquabacterium soli]
MSMSSMRAGRALSSIALACGLMGSAFAGGASGSGPTLEGFAVMPANTLADGPTSGQFAGTGQFGNVLPLVGRQPVQGLSAVLAGPLPGTFRVMTDNGFGTQANSADALLRVYAVRPDFKTRHGGSGTVKPVSNFFGLPLKGFNGASRITLRDPDHKLGFALVADSTHYYNVEANPLVDPAIKAQRLLTGADLDIEAMRRDKRGNLWFGDEFGPFLVKTDATGKVLRREIPLPNFSGAGGNALVQSPQYPGLVAGTNNLRNSNGFEGLAINPQGDTLYALLEGPLIPDTNQKRLLINEFSIDQERYTGRTYAYRLEPEGTNIGDMTAVNDHEYLVIERNGGTATTALAPFKKIFKIDLKKVDAEGFVKKTELVDLMNIADPHDLNGDGGTRFTFPYVTIEDVLVLDARTLLVINDNNYPGGGGRALASDNTEFLRIRLDERLDMDSGPGLSWAWSWGDWY